MVAVKTRVYERVFDYRAGVALELLGLIQPVYVANTARTFNWCVRYIGNYGFEGDPKEHVDYFETLEDATERWKELVKDYRSRALSVDRLKAFKKDWVPKTVSNYEALLWEKDGLTAVLSSQGPKSRRKRIWVISASAIKLGIEPMVMIFVPFKEAAGVLPPEAIRVPISRMNAEVRQAWDKLVQTYESTR